jgi:hypothetical protein
MTTAPDVDAALNAFDTGDEETLALYLGSSAPDHRVLAAILRALSASGETDFRLKFIRRKQGQPRADEHSEGVKDAVIYWTVETACQELLAAGKPERGIIKQALGIVADRRGEQERTVRLAYERCKRLMAE